MKTDTIAITIDGLKIEAKKGANVLDIALENGIYIPHLCHHPDLVPMGICRLCLVEFDGKWMGISCKMPAKDGMVVKTNTPEVQQARKIAVELIIANHPMNCLSCAKDTTCQLQRAANFIGIEDSRMKRMRRDVKVMPKDESNPFFVRDLSKCVLCGICIRTCDEIVGVNAIDFARRGVNSVVATLADKPIAESNCVSCGECVARCPVGALVPKKHEPPAREVKTVCTYCGVGCNLYLGVRGEEIVGVRGAREAETNHGNLCVKGRYGYGFVNHPDRLKRPLVRKDGELVETDWEEALDVVAQNLSKHKGDEFALLSSARCSNEENYLAQKFTRAVMGTNNIDHCARL
ncbi:formate dehydrogenase, alpha subunit (selenocysteine-containing) [Candidatus Desulfarcum epimagneticum]|uniref:Formate dehydrogenase, alpha subunit (Selenocysteine-containing) n=1 Tax=uncultured Desulfobacteraceae bacterium TaxID=218296 RepID=A0A484HHZ8_9BACT|nr:formate dehydrogenase, alpha subunit (selenocysteine-containing) [uncultured Desulfobacteraceae bacterium]